MKDSTPHRSSLSLFDGKVCSRCHCWRSFAEYHREARAADECAAQCKHCVKLYREANRETRAAACKAWHARNREHSAAYQKAHLAQLGEAARERDRLYRERARERNPNLHRDAYRRNPERRREISRQWVKRNLEKCLIFANTRRARLAGVGGRILLREWRALKERYAYTCLCCKRGEPEIMLTLDHVVPIVKGGPNTIENAQPLCRQCNSRKNAQTIDYRPG